ncbi:MAG: TetR family transcriptional regulator [Chloroflexota bacterium]
MRDVKAPSARRPTLRDERAAVTRRRIADAARRLFRRDGYAATTLRAVAAEAGVAVQTVYAVYGSKAGILGALREGVVSQPEAGASFEAAMAEPSAERRLALFARSIRLRWELTGDIVAINEDAAMADAAIRAGVAEAVAARWRGIARFTRAIEDDLRPGIDVERSVALVHALTLYDLYAELVDIHGWTPDAYESWLAAALVREVLGTTA